MSGSTGPARRKPPRSRGTIGGGNPLTDPAEHTDPVSPLAGATWSPSGGSTDASAPATPAPPPGPAAPTAPGIPEPYEVDEEVTGPLDAREREYLAVCEAALDTLRTAFYYAGRALQVIRDGRLYRETHENFEDYVLDRWKMSRPQAYRLIDAWPIAQRLSPIGDNSLTESQVRELVPVSKTHGQDAAVTVYETIATTDGVKVTAGVIKGAVSALPDQWDRSEAVERIRAYLAGRHPAPTAHADDGANVYSAASTKLHALAARVVRHASDHPDQVRKFADDLRTLADQVEKELS